MVELDVLPVRCAADGRGQGLREDVALCSEAIQPELGGADEIGRSDPAGNGAWRLRLETEILEMPRAPTADQRALIVNLQAARARMPGVPGPDQNTVSI